MYEGFEKGDFNFDLSNLVKNIVRSNKRFSFLEPVKWLPVRNLGF